MFKNFKLKCLYLKLLVNIVRISFCYISLNFTDTCYFFSVTLPNFNFYNIIGKIVYDLKTFCPI